jgi:polysaccharide biosynthesis transport protein
MSEPIDSSTRALTLTDLLSMCWRRRWLASATALVVAATVVLVTFRMTPLFEATALLSVDRGRKTVDFQYDPSNGMVEYSFLNTHRDMLMATPVLEQTLKTSDLMQGSAYASTTSDPIKVLRNRVKVTTRRDSWVITVALRDEDPERAKRALGALLAAYAANQAAQKTEKARDALSFLSTSVDNARDRLDEGRKREQDFRIAKGIVSTTVDSSPVTKRLDDLNKERTSLDQQLAEIQALLLQFEANELITAADQRLLGYLRIKAVGQHEVVIEFQKQWYKAQDDAQALAQKYGDKHPRMREAQQLIDAKRERLSEAVELAKSSVVAQYQKLALQQKELLSRMQTAEKELNEYRTNLASFQALSAETTSREDMFHRLLTRMGEEEVASRLDARQVIVIAQPESDAQPVNIKKSLFALGALAAGIVSGVLAVLAAEALDFRVRGAGATQSITGLTLLGQIPFVAGLQQLGRDGDPDKPPALSESYRALRAALRLMRKSDTSSQILVITSSGPNEGKSTVSTRLAIALAAAGARVLLVDTDLRKPTLQKQLGDERERGLSFLLAGEKDITPHATNFTRLDFLPVGVRPPNPAELLNSKMLAESLSAWRNSYDYVLVDTPPLGLVSDALIVGELADGIMLVVRDRVTMKHTLRQVLGRLEPLRSKVLGFIFNAEQLDSAGYGSYHYHYGYQYGSSTKPDATRA